MNEPKQDGFKIGDRVECVNDAFNAHAKTLGYTALPKRGETYIVRHVGDGRTRLKNAGPKDVAKMVLLEELRNPADRMVRGGGKELGFSALRFRRAEAGHAAVNALLVAAALFGMCALLVWVTAKASGGGL